jgi:hypothetical protein
LKNKGASNHLNRLWEFMAFWRAWSGKISKVRYLVGFEMHLLYHISNALSIATSFETIYA